MINFFAISFDNATANTSAINYLQNDLNLLLNGLLLYVRCCAHILNLCVQDGLGSINCLVEPIRKIVKWIRHNRNAKNEFKRLCQSLGLKPKHFCLDTPTRWNST